MTPEKAAASIVTKTAHTLRQALTKKALMVKTAAVAAAADIGVGNGVTAVFEEAATGLLATIENVGQMVKNTV